MLKILAPAGPARRRTAVAVALVLAAAGAGLYGTVRLRGNQGQGECAAAAVVLARLAPLATGDVAAFEVAKRAVPAADLRFEDGDGRARSLADYRGRTVLLNLWATWCEPCKQEMPALDRLQAELGGPAFEVVAVNIDTRNLDRPRTWLEAAGIRRLAYHSDREAMIFQDLKRAGDAEGMPTTLLIDPRGCRLGRIFGPADWAGRDALALIRAALSG